MKLINLLCTAIGLIGSAITYLLGGWDSAMVTLIMFMVIDYVSGLMVAGVFKASTKTKTGGLESRTGWKGLCRKCMTLFFVLIANRIDMTFGIEYTRNCVIIGFITNELLSIIENAGLMGAPIPEPILNAIDILKQKSLKSLRKKADEK